MTNKRFNKEQKVKYTDNDGKVICGVFESYGTNLRGDETVYAYWNNKDYPTWLDADKVVSAESEVSENNINQDIIQLIESGYEFKTFWGATFDGKEFHIEVEDQQ